MSELMPEDAESLEAASAMLASGRVVVIPTDTVYGLAARVDRASAVKRLFEVKGRERTDSIPVLVPGLEAARSLAETTPAFEALAERFWPGALTIVVRRARGFAADLGADRETVGMRMPDREFCITLMQRSGPLAVTSANPSGRPTPVEVDEIRRELGANVDLYVDGGTAHQSRPSTVVSLVGEPKLLRDGLIGWEEIRQVL